MARFLALTIYRCAGRSAYRRRHPAARRNAKKPFIVWRGLLRRHDAAPIYFGDRCVGDLSLFGDKALVAKAKTIDRSFATIEFSLDRTILTAKENFLASVGDTLAEVRGKHHGIVPRAGRAGDRRIRSVLAESQSRRVQIGGVWPYWQRWPRDLATGAATGEIARNAPRTSHAAQEVTVNIGGVSQAATEIGSAAGQVSSAAADLSTQAERLNAQVGTFLAGVRAA